MAKREVKLTFPEELITEPVVYKLGYEFKVITNIIRANVTNDFGWVVLELTGESKEIDRAIQYLQEKGVKVETVDSSEHVDF